VSQISPPIRILLVLVIAVLGIYMLFLRPKPEVVPPADPAPNTQTAEPAVSDPGKVAEAAQGAVDAANDQLAQQESVDGVDAGESAAASASAVKKGANAAAAAAPAEDLKGLPKPVRNAIRKDQVLVLLFWNEDAADDRAVRAALRKVDRHDGRVYVQAAPINQISKYGRIARGVDVEQSPTVVVADRDLRAETLVGYVDRATIDQAVVDALRSADHLFTSAYLRKADAVCVRHGNSIAAIPYIYTDTVREADKRLAALDRAWPRFVADFKAIKTPKRYRAFHAATVADYAAFATVIHNASVAVTPKSNTASVVSAHGRFAKATNPLFKRSDRRVDAKGLYRCGSQF
jgi:hypothetical protein